MKIFYFRNEMFVPGGIGRVLSDRINYLIEKEDYEIYIIVMNQEGKELFYLLNDKVKVIDLEIPLMKKSNFIIDYIKNIFRRKIYKEKIEKIIEKEKPDILVSLGDSETAFLHKIKVDSNIKRIREYHFNKNFRFLKESLSFIDKLRAYRMKRIEENNLKYYNQTIVLTNEDKKNWNDERIKVIPNPLPFYPEEFSKCENKKIISVGRLSYEKGYDILIDVWNIISKKYPDWILEIYGEGSERENLQNKINKLGLEKSFLLKGATKDIQDKYLESSIYVMSSRYEGMPMVLLEAMACGLPAVSFDCPCGPKDIIKNNEDGFIVKFGNIEQMAEKIEELIIDEEKRKLFGKNARKNVQRFSQDKIMNQWKELYENIYNKK